MNQKENRPRILIIGHARHGKDTAAEYLRHRYNLKFLSSSDFVGRKCIWPFWGQQRYDSYEEMFADRVNHRELWSNLISAYNTPDKARTAREMLQEEGADMYVGMRMADEFDASIKEELFTHVIWIDGSVRHPSEPNPKMQMDRTMATHVITNNDEIEYTYRQLDAFVKILVEQGYHWDGASLDTKTHNKMGFERKEVDGKFVYLPLTETPSVEDNSSIDMNEIPENAIKVLDHGYILLVDYMGDDQAIADSARVSYGRGTKMKRDPEGLINYLWNQRHTSPFEMAEVKFQIRMPIFVMRQWVRHRTANLNEYSGRYSVMPRMWYQPNHEDIKGQSKTNKQASDSALTEDNQKYYERLIWEACNQSFNAYEEMIGSGVSREMARIVLPLNTYTEVVWKMDLKNLLDFIRLRNDPHAQPEIQAYAKVIEEFIAKLFPLAYKAYQEMKAKHLLSMNQIMKILTGSPEIELSKREAAQVEEVMAELRSALPDAVSSLNITLDT